MDRRDFAFSILSPPSSVRGIEFVWYNHEKKTLRKRKKYLDIWIDSLEDIAANKVMALIDRNEPKDLYDIYFLINKGKFTPVTLLRLVQKKFGFSISEATFWGECFRKVKKLQQVKPLLPHRKENLLAVIEKFIADRGRKFLKLTLK